MLLPLKLEGNSGSLQGRNADENVDSHRKIDVDNSVFSIKKQKLSNDVESLMLLPNQETY